MGGYIRIDKDLPDDYRVKALTGALLEHFSNALQEALQLPESCGLKPALQAHFRPLLRNAIVGSLALLWRYSDTHIDSDNALHLTLQDLADEVGLSLEVLQKFPTKWLVVNHDGTVELPDFIQKNAIMAKDRRKEKNRERVRKHRAKRRAEKEGITRNAGNKITGVTSALPPEPDPGPEPDPPKPGPDPEKISEPHTEAQHGALASAHGHLARRTGAANGNAAEPTPRTTKSPAQLEADARLLAKTGLNSGDIARCLGQYGVTAPQVMQWLSNAPPEAAEQAL